MTLGKRMLDLVLALTLAALFLLPMLVVLTAMWATQGRPLFYVDERMAGPGRPFRLWKLRTMRPAPPDGVATGGQNADRITPMGRFLRRSRLDEVPQLWNILRGDMSFVGPRPPRRRYVERFPDLYGAVLRCRPGVTGLASLHYHKAEERIMAACPDAATADAVYSRRCVPRKARLDLIYQRHQSLCFDLAILWQTFAGVLMRGGAVARR
jgi:lipopolysaccharide/colanic/teichoic acid biosynthesis glycosyltransferase